MTVDYPALRVGLFQATFPAPLGEIATPSEVLDALRPDADMPLARDEAVRVAVRDLLRQRGYKPTGRGKPASEFLAAAAEAGRLGPINAAVDICNAVSLHSGLPISIVDLDRTGGELAIRAAEPGASYVFNASGQTISVAGLPCLVDDAGPCANAVRDSQRTKTHGRTKRTLWIVWAPEGLADRLDVAEEWAVRWLSGLGATVEGVMISGPDADGLHARLPDPDPDPDT